jgi:PAS domain S-box-containing protein
MAKKPTYEELEQRVKQLEQTELNFKKTEEALRESEARFRLLYERAPLGYQSLDKNGHFIEVNQAWLDTFGYTREEVIGKSFGDFLHPDWIDHFKENFPRFKAIGEILGVEFEIVKKDGSTILVSFNGKIGRNEIGEFKQTHCILNDITKQRRSEEALRESEEKYRTLVESSSDTILMLDTERNIVSCNQAFLNLFGYTRKEVEGRSIRMIHLSDESFRSFGDAAYPEIERSGSYRKEWEFMRKGGSIVPAETAMSVIKSPNELTEGYVAIIRDISERKNLEAQLRQTQKMESIGTLAGGIAHDFNNILSAIIGYTEIALYSVEQDSQLYNNLQEVFRAGNRAKDLVKQILTFSRQTEQERRPVQVKLIVNEALKLLRASLPSTIEVGRNIQSDALVMADSTQIHQILMNLCTNADHAMREKGGVLRVELEDVELDEDFTASHPNMKPGSYLNLMVSDTGHGMPPDVLERIFDPFFTTKETGEGTGMGLSGVHGIVGSYGGAITAYSEPGQGSTFKVYLPIIERHKEPHVEAEESIPTGSERILFVDDEPALTNIGKHVLESQGYDVETRTSSIEALELFKNQPDRFDLVITDMTMSNMTGEDLAQELMRIKPNIPIILCTGFSAKIDDQKARAMGIRAFVLKPIVKQAIATTVRKVLDEK